MSSQLMLRRALLALAGAAALAAAAPAVASADSLMLTPSSVPAASTSTSLEMNASFSPATTSITGKFPPGLLANASIDGGACLATAASSSPPAACSIGSGKIDGLVPVDVYLVQAPASGDIAGVEVNIPSLTTFVVGAVTVRPASDPAGVGLNLSFSGLPAVSALDVKFTDLRMPTSCPGTGLPVTVSSDSNSTTQQLTVTGCSALAYNPTLTAQVTKDSGDDGATIVSTISQPNAATESATKATTLGFGSSLSPNVLADANCFTGTACTVGTASATSPLLPNAAFAGGTATLGGTLSAPTLTISFPALNLSLVGAIDLTSNTVTFASQPDVPLSSLTTTVTGPSGVTSPNGGKAFTTSCAASTLTGAFTPWDGNAAVSASAPIAYTGCSSGGGGGNGAGSPSVSSSLSGLSGGHPKLHFAVRHGANAPDVSSVSVSASSGLKFRKCAKQGKSCKGLAVSGATVKSVKVSGGRLTIVFAKAVGKATVTVGGPLLKESSSLQSRVKKHKVKKVTVTFKVTDSSGKATTISKKLAA